jgi:hypothetical protein
MAPFVTVMTAVLSLSLLHYRLNCVGLYFGVLTKLAYGQPRSSRGISCPQSPFHDSLA